MDVSGHEFLAGGWVLGRVSLEGVGPVVSGVSRSLYPAAGATSACNLHWARCSRPRCSQARAVSLGSLLAGSDGVLELVAHGLGRCPWKTRSTSKQENTRKHFENMLKTLFSNSKPFRKHCFRIRKQCFRNRNNCFRIRKSVFEFENSVFEFENTVFEFENTFSNSKTVVSISKTLFSNSKTVFSKWFRIRKQCFQHVFEMFSSVFLFAGGPRFPRTPSEPVSNEFKDTVRAREQRAQGHRPSLRATRPRATSPVQVACRGGPRRRIKTSRHSRNYWPNPF